ncbi:pyruvate dehydrogenase E1 component beta subunit [Branchiibius hedensis]|uniref:Pyruvate dehydrogenase E1 component beta subunit n=1 Tax=Branchiibius hedensis TaxID=672460 RepID=A0A2Y8ZUZ3_9MICO|nr:alpha-ketoacid dehydrogenase subunit beta [Branchiibius hedensis]PWJ27300.1 pyruvate dehydrogenase E1 component beta subunit [Branchiibius hedensis]SSA36111.1 pyruvate dehydrogenase E1 component beta subunit [Branchiibius hedensis]
MSTEKLSLAKALNEGLRTAMERDPKVVLMGEDVGKLGGVFRITEGLQKDFGDERVVDTPLAESGIVGTAVGLALRGYRPVVEIQFDGFIYPGFDQIVSQVAKMHSRSGGRLALPLVIRVPYGGGIGAVEHHSESNEAYFAHTAGLRVVACADPVDAYWMIQQAIASQDPVMFYEPKRRYHEKGDFPLGTRDAAPAGLHEARIVRDGSDVTILTYGSMVRTCVQAAETAATEGKSVQVLNLRSLNPIDTDAIMAAARKTGRVIVVHEASTFLGMGAELAAQIQTECFYHLQAPVLRVGGYNLPYPPSRYEREFLPDLDRILDAVDTSLKY